MVTSKSLLISANPIKKGTMYNDFHTFPKAPPLKNLVRRRAMYSVKVATSKVKIENDSSNDLMVSIDTYLPFSSL